MLVLQHGNYSCDMKTEEKKKQGFKDSRATEPIVQFLVWTRPHLQQDTQRGDGLVSLGLGRLMRVRREEVGKGIQEARGCRRGDVMRGQARLRIETGET